MWRLGVGPDQGCWSVGEQAFRLQRSLGFARLSQAEVLALGPRRSYDAPFLLGRCIMTYTLHRLAPGSYDLHLDGELIGGVVRISEHQKLWVAELLVDAPPEARPRPFTEVEHTFSSFVELQRWLGDAPVRSPVMIT